MAPSRQPIDLVFCGAEFKIRPLTFRQVQDIETKLGDKSLSAVGQAQAIVAVALSRDFKDVDASGLEGDTEIFSKAMTDILLHGGFLMRASSGEAEAPLSEQTGADSEGA